ncbi:MAG: SDR family oxidoreductase [Pseudomonadota bacterium]|jgi:short-subunit dehydrogenase
MSQVVLVTGAAGGIGAAVAARFARGGAQVLLTDLPGPGLAAQAAQLGAPAYSADLRSTAACQALIAWAVATAGGLDVLVNVAGVWREGLTEATAEADFDLVMGVNFKGLYFVTAAAIPHLRARRGLVVNLSSDAGLQGNTGAALYCASKGAVSLFTKALALELAGDVRVVAVCPGDVQSPMLAFQAQQYGGGDPAAYYAKLLAGYPQGARARFIEPDEVASLIEYLARPEAAPITGALLSIDFGYSAGK